MIFGYSRVSKGEDQSDALQRRAFETAGVERVFFETAGRWDRPELHRMIDQLRAGDVIIVWKLDRLSRSLKDRKRCIVPTLRGCGGSGDCCPDASGSVH